MQRRTRLLCTVLLSCIIVSAAMIATTDGAAAQTGATWIDLVSFGGPDCDPELQVTNVGSNPSKAAVIFFTDRDTDTTFADPYKVECSGLIVPGGSWTFTASSLPTGVERAAVVSFTTQKLSEIGVVLSADDVVGDYMCESLFFGVVGDRADYDRFATAYSDGADFAGVPMADAAGSPMVASIDVSGCGSTAVLVSPRLIEAVPAPVVESALANPAAVSGYGILRDPGKPASPYNSYRTCLSLRNLSVPWHPLHNALVFKAACH